MRQLTPRQAEILLMLAQDVSTKEIAERLGLTYRAVRNHVEDARIRVGAYTVAAAVWAARGQLEAMTAEVEN